MDLLYTMCVCVCTEDDLFAKQQGKETNNLVLFKISPRRSQTVTERCRRLARLQNRESKYPTISLLAYRILKSILQGCCCGCCVSTFHFFLVQKHHSLLLLEVSGDLKKMRTRVIPLALLVLQHIDFISVVAPVLRMWLDCSLG